MKVSRQVVPLAVRAAAATVAITLLSRPIHGQPVLPADQVIRNAIVITVDSGSRIAPAVAIRGERIVAVGSNDELQPLIGPSTKLIDAGGKTVLPGLYDSSRSPPGRSSERG